MPQFRNTKEFYDLRIEFEKTCKGLRIDREESEMNKNGAFYQDDKVNALFISFLFGYQLAKNIYQ